jgi:hypothetical protein
VLAHIKATQIFHTFRNKIVPSCQFEALSCCDIEKIFIDYHIIPYSNRTGNLKPAAQLAKTPTTTPQNPPSLNFPARIASARAI